MLTSAIFDQTVRIDLKNFIGLIFLAVPTYAFAWGDGQDALLLIVIQTLILLLSLVVFAFHKISIARRSYAFLGCIIGIVASWIVSSAIPFNDNRALVAELFIYLPIFGFFISFSLTEKPRTLWKTYFFFFLALSAPSLTPLVYFSTLEWLIDLSFLLVTIAGLYGYAWKQAIFNLTFWKVFVPICLIWNIGHAFVMIETIEPLITTALALPSWLGIFLYAFRKSQIWQPQSIHDVRKNFS
jgi:hypothetical protein